MLVAVLIAFLVVSLIAAFPAWPHSRGWGYGPSRGIGIILIIVVVLLLLHVF